MKILIDTNIFLDFYRSNNNPIELLKEVYNNIENIILTDQIIQEFERSREVVIKTIQKRFETESKLDNFSSSYVKNLSAFKELLELQKLYQDKRTEVIATFQKILQNPDTDPIASFFTDFVNEALRKNLVLFTTDEIVAQAQKRKLIGNPPTSDKYSIGDEINWEIILKNVIEDIVIVGRDNTYTNNFSFLVKDFHKGTGHSIIKLTESITDAFNEIGVATSPEVKQAEKRIIDDIRHANDYWRPYARKTAVENNHEVEESGEQ